MPGSSGGGGLKAKSVAVTVPTDWGSALSAPSVTVSSLTMPLAAWGRPVGRGNRAEQDVAAGGQVEGYGARAARVGRRQPANSSKGGGPGGGVGEGGAVSRALTSSKVLPGATLARPAKWGSFPVLVKESSTVPPLMVAGASKA